MQGGQKKLYLSSGAIFKKQIYELFQNKFSVHLQRFATLFQAPKTTL